MSHDLPEGWQEVALTDCLEDFRNGWTYDTRATDGLMPITRIETISNGRIDYNRVGLAQPDDRLEAFRLHRNDILFSHINSVEHIGKVAIKEDDRPLYHGMNLIRLRPNAKVEPGFLFARLQSEATRAHFRSACKRAVNQASLNKGEIGGYHFALPPLDEQRRIAEVLRSLDEAIVATQDVIVQLREVRSHRLDAFMTLPGAYKRIEDVCRLSGGNGFPIKHQGKPAGRYPFAKVSDMNRLGNEVLMRHAENYVDDADVRTLKAKTFPVGTTFFPKVGATLLTNKRRISAVEMLVDNNVMGAVATGIDPWFLYYAFCTIDMADYVQPGAVPSVNQRTIGQIMIPVPPKSEQERFAQSMRDLDLAIEAQSDALGQLRQSKAMIATDLLSGHVRVPV